jgi:hypothetical protein
VGIDTVVSTMSSLFNLIYSQPSQSTSQEDASQTNQRPTASSSSSTRIETPFMSTALKRRSQFDNSQLSSIPESSGTSSRRPLSVQFTENHKTRSTRWNDDIDTDMSACEDNSELSGIESVSDDDSLLSTRSASKKRCRFGFLITGGVTFS